MILQIIKCDVAKSSAQRGKSKSGCSTREVKDLDMQSQAQPNIKTRLSREFGWRTT